MSGQFIRILELVFTFILFVHQHHHLSLHVVGGFLVRLTHLAAETLMLTLDPTYELNLVMICIVHWS